MLLALVFAHPPQKGVGGEYIRKYYINFIYLIYLFNRLHDQLAGLKQWCLLDTSPLTGL